MQLKGMFNALLKHWKLYIFNHPNELSLRMSYATKVREINKDSSLSWNLDGFPNTDIKDVKTFILFDAKYVAHVKVTGPLYDEIPRTLAWMLKLYISMKPVQKW